MEPGWITVRHNDPTHFIYHWHSTLFPSPWQLISCCLVNVVELTGRFYAQIKIDLSNFEDIYEFSLQLEIGVGIDACREYVDETLSPATAPMLLSM
jgi:hypothetical protein